MTFSTTHSIIVYRRDKLSNKDKAAELVLNHNRLMQSVSIVELLLEGLAPKDIRNQLGVSLPQVYRVRSKYIIKETDYE